MTETEYMLAASAATDPMAGHILAAARECAPYRWTDPWAVDPHGAQDAPPVDVPAPQPVVVRGDTVTGWRVRPVGFWIALDCLIISGGKGMAFDVERVADQITGLTATGAEIRLTAADVRAMTPDAGKFLIKAVRLLGDIPTSGKPERVGTGDMITAPMVVQAATGKRWTFRARTLADVEQLGVHAHTATAIEYLMSLSDAERDDVERMTTVDGFFLVGLIPEIQKTANRVLSGVRSYEMALKVQFQPDTELAVLAAKQTAYGELFDRQAKAQKAAASNPRPTRRRR